MLKFVFSFILIELAWAQFGKLSVPRSDLAGAAAGNKIVFAGGYVRSQDHASVFPYLFVEDGNTQGVLHMLWTYSM